MAKKTGAFLEGGIRTLSQEQFFKALEENDVARQIITYIRWIFETLPFGNFLQNTVRSFCNNHLSAKVLAGLEPILEELFRGVDEDDDMKKKKKSTQGGKGKEPNPANAWNNIYALPQLRQQEIVVLQIQIKVTESKLPTVLGRIAEMKPDTLIALANSLLDKKDDANILAEPQFLDLASVRVAPVRDGEAIISDEIDQGMKMLDWLEDDDANEFSRVMGVKNNKAYDSKIDGPSFFAWLAQYYRLGKEDGVRLLKAAINGRSDDEIAQMANVRQNYVNKALGIPKTVFNWLRGKPIEDEAFTGLLALVNQDREARGDPKIELPQSLTVTQES